MNFTFPLPSVDWTAEKGYPDDAPEDGFPWKPKGLKVFSNIVCSIHLEYHISPPPQESVLSIFYRYPTSELTLHQSYSKGLPSGNAK